MNYFESRVRAYIKTWEGRGYPEGIPDEGPPELESNGLIPSYKRICKAILSNDMCLQSLGFAKPSCQTYDTLKKIELGISLYSPQMELFK
jgi:predicted phosphoadenosine phosphosulfate sulfurtransferase